MAAKRTPPRPHPAPRAVESGEGEVSLSTIIKVVGAVAAVVIGLGAIIAPLWGYFSLQRDTADSKAKLQEISNKFDEYAKRSDERIAAAEKETRRIDSDGTQYGRNKVDARMQEINKIDGRVDKIENSFNEMRPIIQRTGDRVEQMWGDYNARANVTPPLIDARRPPRR